MKRIVILVEPENPLNVGFVARAMKCSGVDELRIVSDRELDDSAYRTGTSAKEILSNAQMFSSLEDALRDCNHSVAFSRRSFVDAADSCDLPDLPDKLNAETVAFVFGRESQGLFSHELACCSIHCAIPIQGTMSYNLGQAVAVALYETENRGTSVSSAVADLASESERMHLLSLLGENAGSFLSKGRRELQLRKVVSKLPLSSDEISFLMGVIRAGRK